jgi:beta-phosphoglucomutase
MGVLKVERRTRENGSPYLMAVLREGGRLSATDVREAQRVMSGKPRYAGAQAVREYFGMPSPRAHAREYRDRKQRMINELIEGSQFHAYPDALRFFLAVEDAGLRIAAPSSSKNANAFLEKIRLDEFAKKEGLNYGFVLPGYTLLDFVDANVSGRDFKQGKPHPEIFLTVAEELGLSPENCFVVEDAVNGVQAAKTGNMAALSLARADDEEMLANANADSVVTNLDDVSLGALTKVRLERAGVR